MATDYTPEPFENWADIEQTLWSNMVQESGHSELQDDDQLQWLYDVAFNTERGDIPGDHRAAIMDAFADHLADKYGLAITLEAAEKYDLVYEGIFDWHAWREMYGEA